MIFSEIKYNSFKEDVKQLSSKYALGDQFANWIDSCNNTFSFEANNQTMNSLELTNEIVLLLNNEKYNQDSSEYFL